MKRFSKEDLGRRDGYVSDLRSAWEEVEAAKGSFQEAIARINNAIEKYNEAIGEAQGWMQDQIDAAQAYYDDRSEKWQEGDAGSSYQDWINDMEGLEFETVDPVREEDLELPDEPDLAGELDEMKTEPDE